MDILQLFYNSFDSISFLPGPPKSLITIKDNGELYVIIWTLMAAVAVTFTELLLSFISVHATWNYFWTGSLNRALLINYTKLGEYIQVPSYSHRVFTVYERQKIMRLWKMEVYCCKRQSQYYGELSRVNENNESENKNIIPIKVKHRPGLGGSQ